MSANAAFRLAVMLMVTAVGAGQIAVAQQPERLRVMTSGGFSAAYSLLAPRFEAATGISVVTTRGASSGDSPTTIPSRLARGEPADLVILARDSLDRLIERGDVRTGTAVDLVRSTIGMAVRRGSDVPDIRTRESFIRAVIESESFGYSESASGQYLSTELFPSLGIWAAIEQKGVQVTGEPVAALVARGEVEIGFQQISEILPVEGVELAGPIPAELQRITTFSAGVAERAENAAGAQALIEFLSSPAVADAIAGTGLSPVAWE